MAAISIKSPAGLRKSGIGRIVTIFLVLSFQVFMVFFGAGNFTNFRIWCFFMLEAFYYLVSVSVMLFVFPERVEIINQRGKLHSGTKRWDHVLITIISFFSLIIIPLTAGFNIGYLRWGQLTVLYFYSFIPLLFIVQVLGQWAIISNPNFEPTVRIQEDRDHKVTQSGPYKYVRHPGYVSFILSSVFSQLIIGSLLALIPVAIVISLFIIRTLLEDKTLQLELPGYREYAKKVKYRLFPGIW